MLVDVVPMREGGHKRPREELLGALAARGELVLGGVDAGGGGDEALVATLTISAAGGRVLPALERARVVRMRGSSMVIAGVEDAGGRPAQSWWVRRVVGITVVDVRQLHKAGVRMPSEMLAHTPAVRGDLQLTPRRPGYHSGQRNAPLLAGVVEAGQIEWALVPLDQARVTRIVGREMVIAGVEEILEGRSAKRYEQVWRVYQPESLVRGSYASTDP